MLAANEKPSDAMKEVMKRTARLAPSQSAAKANDLAAVAKDAGTYRANFAYIEAYFTHKKMDAAATMAKGGVKAATDLETAALQRIAGGRAGCHRGDRHLRRVPQAVP